MSKGLGKIERDMLKLLQESEHLDTMLITALVYEVKPDKDDKITITGAQHASTRRALLSLKRKGLAFPVYGLRSVNGRKIWATKDKAISILDKGIKLMGKDILYNQDTELLIEWKNKG